MVLNLTLGIINTVRIAVQSDLELISGIDYVQHGKSDNFQTQIFIYTISKYIQHKMKDVCKKFSSGDGF